MRSPGHFSVVAPVTEKLRIAIELKFSGLVKN